MLEIMKLNPDITLRAIGSRYMIVNNASEEVDFTDIYCLNDTAAWLWKKIGAKEFSEEILTDWLCEAYIVERKIAQSDVEQLVKGWRQHGLILNE